MFRAMFSPIIRSTRLYLQHLVLFTQVAAGWCHGWVETHVSGDVFAHHQEHSTVFTASGIIHPSCCPLVSWMSCNSCFGRCFRPSSGALNCIYSIWYYSPKLLPAGVMDEFQLMLREMFSPIIRSTWLYLQHLVLFTQVAAGWCHGWVETHVSGHVLAHHQEHLTVFTASGIIHRSCCRLVSWMSFNSCFGRCFRPSSGALDYLQHLVLFTQAAAGWCHGWVETHV